MSKPFGVILMIVVAALLAASSADAASRHKMRQARAANTGSGEAAFWGGLVPMENGVPVIMKGYHPPKAPPEELAPQQRTERPVHIPRGSSSFVDIPPVNPSPNRGPTPQQIIQQGQAAVQPYNPPPINSFGDRVTNAIHDFPLQRGLGNNPNDLQSFIRQRANQP
jgi:hypothetical protein